MIARFSFILSLLTLSSLMVLSYVPSSRATKPVDKIFKAEHFTLDNGLEIVVIPNHRAPVVTHMVWYKVGAADEPRGKSGIAHFLEHLLFKGSDGLAPGEFSKIIRALGGQGNAFTSQDYTAYYQSISVDHLETVMRMESGRMRGLNPPLEEVEAERKVILEERRQRTDNDPRARFGEQMSASLYINHPYGTPVIGWMHEMETLSWDDAKSFYDRWYGPNNAILIVSGDVTGAQVYELAQKTYGAIAPISVPVRERTISPPLNSQTLITLEHPVIRQAFVQKIFRVPSARASKSESLALEILQEIMGGGSTSRLYKSLVIEQKIASNAGLSYSGSAWDNSTLWLHATPLPDQTLEILRDALDEELRFLVQKGVTPTELDEAKTRMMAEAIYARDSLQGPAMIFGYTLATGGTINDIEYWPDDISKVTAKDIQEVARKYLNPDDPADHPPITGFLLPLKNKIEQNKVEQNDK